jgi:predicted DNA-binding transcriptional regulator YafY
MNIFDLIILVNPDICCHGFVIISKKRRIMRADRLISLLMLLQSRGRMKAQELARELEVSERTVYRDIDALSAAGVPIYGECGREGGFALLDSYQTRLTGMTDEELRSLFMLSIPEPLNDLGISLELKKALLKLSAALPDARRGVEDALRLRFFIDSSGWEKRYEPLPYLQVVYQAVRQDRRLHIVYQPMVNITLDKWVEPYGLVAKSSEWYLISATNGKISVHSISELLQARLGDETFLRPSTFNVAAFWKEWCAQQANASVEYHVKLRVFPRMVPFIKFIFGLGFHATTVQTNSTKDVVLEMTFESLEAARSRLLPLGSGVEVLEPEALRCSVYDYAQQIVQIYSSGIGKL